MLIELMVALVISVMIIGFSYAWFGRVLVAGQYAHTQERAVLVAQNNLESLADVAYVPLPEAIVVDGLALRIPPWFVVCKTDVTFEGQAVELSRAAVTPHELTSEERA